MQVYEIFAFFRLFWGKKQLFESWKAVNNPIFSSKYTKMALSIWHLTKTSKKNYSKILTFPYIYGKISRLNARRSERLLRCLTAMVHVGNFRGVRWFTRQQMWGRVHLPLGKSEADHLLAFIRTGSPGAILGSVLLSGWWKHTGRCRANVPVKFYN